MAEEELEFLGSKLRRGISLGKKGGSRTPVPTWKLEDPTASSAAAAGPSSPARRSAAAAVSARKLGANLWEVQDLGRRRSGDHRKRRDEILFDLCDQPQSAGSLRRHGASSLIQQYKSNQRKSQAHQPASPATNSSSTEVSTINRAVHPSSSLDLKEMLREGREGRHSLKTSTELVKVLNRIWSLEEQHASTVSQVKELKSELKHARSRIQELTYDKQTFSHEMDNLVSEIAEDKLIRKKKEQDKINTAVQSIRDELEDEKKLRRKSESLHRKLVKELSEVKSTLSKALHDLDREKEANGLVENLCDVLAEGVRNYELEVRELHQKAVKELDHTADRWVLHISEAWLDQRLQMKIAEARGDIAERNTIMDSLRTQVMDFLQAKQSKTSTKDIASHNNVSLRRQSLESLHLNGTASAPQDAEDDDSISSDMHCFELNLDANDGQSHDGLEAASGNGVGKSDNAKMSRTRRKKVGYFGRKLGKNSSNMHGSHSHNSMEAESIEPNQVEIALSRISKNYPSQENGLLSLEMDDKHKSNIMVDNHDINQSSKRGPNSLNGIHTFSSPVLKRNYVTSSPKPEISECASRLASTPKDNTLKAKLLEARLEGRHARMKASKGSSVA